MPSLIDFRRRIRSVKSTQQITKAMKMVAAARLRKAQDRVIASRPYATMLGRLLESVSAAAGAGSSGESLHPLLASRPEERVQLVLLTSDRGWAGAFNSNLIKASQNFIASRGSEKVEIEAIGRKARDFYRSRPVKMSGEMTGFTEKPTFDQAKALASKLAGRYMAGEIDAVYLIYNEFKSVISQKVTEVKLLPVTPPDGADGIDYIYEEPPAQLIGALVDKYVQTGIYRAMLETAAAQFAARMTAMDAATSNARDVIDKLTLHMNRVRQASITKEIIEVVSGASALE